MRPPDTRDPGQPEPDPLSEALSLHPGWWRSLADHDGRADNQRDTDRKSTPQEDR